jgi:hypothetical protein
MAPPDRLEAFLGAGDVVGVEVTVLIELMVELVLVVVDDELLMLEDDVVNRARSLCWKATVMGCAHITMKPDTTVNIAVVPSSDDVMTPGPSEANTVVGLALVNILVQPKYCAVIPPALTLLIKVV